MDGFTVGVEPVIAAAVETRESRSEGDERSANGSGNPHEEPPEGSLDRSGDEWAATWAEGIAGPGSLPRSRPAR